MAWGGLGANLRHRWRALRILKSTPEWSRMVVSVINVLVCTPMKSTPEWSRMVVSVMSVPVCRKDRCADILVYVYVGSMCDRV